jgi:NAD(P)-dependent dehydrogenase (short-subunit alcohol dehydrogenase family)/acyl carrier protein
LGRDHGDKTASCIYQESTRNTRDHSVAFRHGYRWVASYEPFLLDEPEEEVLKQKGTYLITGGLGQAGICFAEHLLKHYEATVLLVGKTPLQGANGNSKTADKINALSHLQTLPGKVFYDAIDITDFHPFQNRVQQALQDFGKIDGVIHAAGNINSKNFKLLEQTDETEAYAHFDPKIKGLLNLYELFKDNRPDFVWAASSLSTVVGGLSYGAYAAANMFMDYFIGNIKNTVPHWISVNLDGLSLRTQHPENDGINSEALIAVFKRSLTVKDHHHLVVSVSDLEERLTKYIARKEPAIISDGQSVQNDSKTERPALSTVYVAAGTDTERRLVALWENCLGIEHIGIQDNFLELGGDSLKAMTLSRKIHKEFEVELTIDFFFKNLTVQSYAQEIEIIRSVKKINAGQRASENVKEIII